MSPEWVHLSILDVRVQKAAVGYLCSTLVNKFDFWLLSASRKTVSCMAGLCPTISTDDMLSFILEIKSNII